MADICFDSLEDMLWSLLSRPGCRLGGSGLLPEGKTSLMPEEMWVE